MKLFPKKLITGILVLQMTVLSSGFAQSAPQSGDPEKFRSIIVDINRKVDSGVPENQAIAVLGDEINRLEISVDDLNSYFAKYNSKESVAATFLIEKITSIISEENPIGSKDEVLSLISKVSEYERQHGANWVSTSSTPVKIILGIPMLTTIAFFIVYASLNGKMRKITRDVENQKNLALKNKTDAMKALQNDPSLTPELKSAKSAQIEASYANSIKLADLELKAKITDSGLSDRATSWGLAGGISLALSSPAMLLYLFNNSDDEPIEE